MNKADFIFETSWEVCNKVGGIYTVLSTKAHTVVEEYKDNYICIGPDISRESGNNHDFIEEESLYKNWKEVAHKEGLKIRIGRWNIAGAPIVFLIDFTSFFEKKDEILTQFWLTYKLDSISGQWDYVEPLLFGYAAGKVIESFYQFHCNAMDKIVAHFHEWMTGGGILYLENSVPQIATVFTTHATVLGRCIAGNNLPLYDNIHQYSASEVAARFRVQSKFSLEYLSAHTADAYSTVSPITDKECTAFFQKPTDGITINGFENNFVPQGNDYVIKRKTARTKLQQVASALLQQPIADNSFFVLNSGRYEFKNKGIDLFIRSLSELKDKTLNRDVVAFIMVPASVSGRREELIQKLNQQTLFNDSQKAVCRDYATHPLHDPNNDPIIKELNRLNLDNAPESRVKVIFVPVYLNGADGIFNLNYYDTLIGFDLTVFPSYYEPWGYTPLESIAFGIPTITTSLAGFGKWVNDNFPQQKGVVVVHRTDNNDMEVCNNIVNEVIRYNHYDEADLKRCEQDAKEVALHALWQNLFANYRLIYDTAIQKSLQRFDLYKNKTSRIGLMVEKSTVSQPMWKRVTIKSNLPANIDKLEEIANNLWWSWNYEARELFIEIAGKERWNELNENPVHMLQMLPLDVMRSFSHNEDFVQKLNRVYQEFITYMGQPITRKEKKVAYFSMEFGISNELKIFSGGLGMLAGDYLKEASDCNVNMVAVGLLYRCGYFTQQICPTGEQINLYPVQSFSKLPIHPLRNSDGDWKTIQIALPGRMLTARIWQVNVGRIKLYLLDTDVESNNGDDRRITYNLYGGDTENRLKQELLLGIGGVRVLNLLNENAEIFHLNEGHAAFLSLERVKNLMEEKHLPFLMAMDLVRASSLFTTHTPVPAGHDAFHEDLMRIYFAHYPEKFYISWQSFMGLGRKSIELINDKFSMSILACRFCQEVNGVSRIHGRVTREMFEYLYDGRFAKELHIGYVTNGVHYPTWAHKKWQQFHGQVLAKNYKQDISNPEMWEKIYQVNDSDIWQIKNELRAEMIANVKELINIQMRQRNDPPSLIVKTIKAIKDNILTIGFARRFATYKRAYLLFMNEEKLRNLVCNPEHPIQFIFAGKAHPNDKAGQDLIKRIIEVSRKPDFIGKIIFVENYDMILAKKLISGCDVWLNTPTRPLEASGTSGEKAVMNGVLNFSVLDGWWAEGYVPNAGWAVDEKITYANNQMQDELDVANLFTIFEEEIIPAFYSRTNGIPPLWVEKMKNNFAKIAPHFNMKRQLDDYYSKYYQKLSQRTDLLSRNQYENLYQLAQWKNKMITGWDNIELISNSLPDEPNSTFYIGENKNIEVKVKLGSINPEEVKVEILFTYKNNDKHELFSQYQLQCIDIENGITTFAREIHAQYTGVWGAAVRIIPANPLLAHDMELNLVKWV